MGNTETPNGTVTVTISDDHNFDRQIIIPPIIFNGIAYSDPEVVITREVQDTRVMVLKFAKTVY